MKNLLEEIKKYDYNYLGIKSVLESEISNKHLSYKSNKHCNLQQLITHLSSLNTQLIPNIIYTYTIEIHLIKTLLINNVETKIITIKTNIKKDLVDSN